MAGKTTGNTGAAVIISACCRCFHDSWWYERYRILIPFAQEAQERRYPRLPVSLPSTETPRSSEL